MSRGRSVVTFGVICGRATDRSNNDKPRCHESERKSTFTRKGAILKPLRGIAHASRSTCGFETGLHAFPILELRVTGFNLVDPSSDLLAPGDRCIGIIRLEAMDELMCQAGALVRRKSQGFFENPGAT